MPIGIREDQLLFAFPEIHEDAVLNIAFMQTLRLPDDGDTYGLPPGLGHFPLRSVDAIRAERPPPQWRDRGGVVLPMWQAEAMWLFFMSFEGYPFAMKVAAGKVNAVNGKPWSEPLDHEDQDFMEIPTQPWLDGFCVERGVVRQFVGMPLGRGYTVEEQVTGKAESGGLQLLVRPLRPEIWERMKAERAARRAERADFCEDAHSFSMGLGAGGRMRQHIYQATHGPDDWHPAASTCFVSTVNALSWRHLTGEAPPHPMPTARDYTEAGLPWFDCYSDAPAIEGATALAAVTTVKEAGEGIGETPLPANGSFDPASAKTVILGDTPLAGAVIVRGGHI